MNIDYPFQFDGRGRTKTTGNADHIRDMIEQLLFTSPGERVNRPDFGTGLLSLLFESNSLELAATLQLTIQAAIQRELGDLVEIRALDVSSIGSSLQVAIEYAIRSTGEQRTDTFDREIRQ